MKKIYYKILDNGGKFYNLKKATDGSAGFDLVAAIKKKIILKGGGHSMAGGCVLEKNKLQAFKKFINS